MSAITGTGARILGPVVPIPHSQPWVVGIIFNNKERIQCGGTLISNKHVISAAHCEAGIGATHVMVGEHDQRINDGEQRIKILKKFMHPDYEKGVEDRPDMIIYELEEEVDNEFAKSAKLPKENEKFDHYIVSGWGSTYSDIDSDVLRSVELGDLKDDPSCNFSYLSNSTIFICAEDRQNIKLGPCGGDSGGKCLIFWTDSRDKCNFPYLKIFLVISISIFNRAMGC